MDSAIQAANERMVYVTGDKEAIRAYERRQMALSDYNSAINYARSTGMAKGRKKGRQEGIAEGMTQGRQEGRQESTLEIARKMKTMGDSIKKIQAVTGLSMETITRL